jgi:hypothetical protein
MTADRYGHLFPRGDDGQPYKPKCAGEKCQVGSLPHEERSDGRE